jgi:hypothetical protein
MLSCIQGSFRMSAFNATNSGSSCCWSQRWSRKHRVFYKGGQAQGY